MTTMRREREEERVSKTEKEQVEQLLITDPRDILGYFDKKLLANRMYISVVSTSEEGVNSFRKSVVEGWNRSPYMSTNLSIVIDTDELRSIIKKRIEDIRKLKRGSSGRLKEIAELSVDLFYFNAATADGWKGGFYSFEPADSLQPDIQMWVACTKGWEPQEAADDAINYLQKKINDAESEEGEKK